MGHKDPPVITSLFSSSLAYVLPEGIVAGKTDAREEPFMAMSGGRPCRDPVTTVPIRGAPWCSAWWDITYPGVPQESRSGAAKPHMDPLHPPRDPQHPPSRGGSFQPSPPEIPGGNRTDAGRRGAARISPGLSTAIHDRVMPSPGSRRARKGGSQGQAVRNGAL